MTSANFVSLPILLGQGHYCAQNLDGCLLEFDVLTTSKVISGWVPTCDSVHSWRLYSAAPLGSQAASNMTRYLTQLHYPNTVPTNPCSILIIATWSYVLLIEIRA